MKIIRCCVFLLTMMFSACIGNNEYIFFYQDEHPDKIFKVNVYYMDAWAYGSHEIRISGQLPEQKEILILEDELRNDGANLSKSNILLEWTDKGVVVSLSGQEQEPKKHTFVLTEGKFQETSD